MEQFINMSMIDTGYRPNTRDGLFADAPNFLQYNDHKRQYNIIAFTLDIVSLILKQEIDVVFNAHMKFKIFTNHTVQLQTAKTCFFYTK